MPSPFPNKIVFFEEKEEEICLLRLSKVIAVDPPSYYNTRTLFDHNSVINQRCVRSVEHNVSKSNIIHHVLLPFVAARRRVQRIGNVPVYSIATVYAQETI